MQFLKYSFSLLCILSTCYASPHFLVKPNCLAQPADAQLIASNSNLSLLKISNDAHWELLLQTQPKSSCGKIVDVTSSWLNAKANDPNIFLQTYNISSQPTAVKSRSSLIYQTNIAELVQKVEPARIGNFLQQLTAFPDRYTGNNLGGSKHGVDAQIWLLEQVKQLIVDSKRSDANAFIIETRGAKNYAQASVLLRIGTSTKPAIIVGAHMDTLSGVMEPKPGADDDGSGSSSIFEAARIILNSQQTFSHPIYFIWYAGEELGLLGSQNVVQTFKNFQIPVKATVQFDMTGYVVNNDFSLWLMQDYVDPLITADLADLITLYTHRHVAYTECGYGCSDHASWTLGGYPASCATESDYAAFNPDMHTAEDTVDKLSLVHMSDFSKLAVAFAAYEAQIIPRN